METDCFAQKLNFGSPSSKGSDSEGSPFKRSCRKDDNKSPVKGFTLFGGRDFSDNVKEDRRTPPPAPRKTKLGLQTVENPIDLLLGDDKGKEKETLHFPFIPATYEVNLTHNAPSDGIKNRMPEFLKRLEKKGSISPTSTPIPSTGNPTIHGSFFGFSPTSDGFAIKTATVAGSNGKGTLDKKKLVKIINDASICRGSPKCAKVHSFHIDHTKKESEADVSIVQELCQPLQIGEALPFLLFVISLLKWLIPKGYYATDLKRDNFGKDKDGNVKWFDFDLKEFVSIKACSFIKSGEFQHDGNPMFQQFLLMLMDFYRQIEENRKSEFAKLNNQAGLLKKLNLLSSDKSVSETTLDDFREVLGNVGLSEEDITYLVGLLTPPPSSQ
jgi:hypothetical protein